MNYKQLSEANALKERIEITKNFRRVLNECRNHHTPTENRIVNIEINGHKYSVTSITYEKILDVLDDEIDRYETDFANYLKPVPVKEKTDDDLYSDAMSNLAQLAINLKDKHEESSMASIIYSIALGIAGDKKLDRIESIVEKNANINLDDPLKVFDV